MNPFKFRNPTELLFGEGMIEMLPKRIPQGSKILLTFGGGSVKGNGVYDDVRHQLKGFDCVEFWGIEPNPKVETLRKAIELGKHEGVNFVLAIGGGSVLDASKLIANAIPSERDAWDLVLKGADRGVKTLPLGTVLTIPATGSEMNRGAVISSTETQEKFGFWGEYPLFSILEPRYTFSLPAYQVACGIADSFVHVMEQYICRAGESPLMDRWAEGIMLTLIEQREAIQREPADYDARANFMLSATMALNGFIAMGITEDWATHRIGHELTALTGLTHGHTLVIVMPALLRVLGHGSKRAKLLHYAQRIWGISSGSEDERIDRAIEQTEAFFRSLGLETRLTERGIGQEVEAEIVRRFAERGTLLGENQDIDSSVVARILQAAR
ncbi:MAG: iron-containing alcohol dehydrogenase [Porphyromonadaceae bacterium]|nr:iron-containing alcohol dehydrogenase [Porphyromonadaceae bacterium]